MFVPAIAYFVQVIPLLGAVLLSGAPCLRVILTLVSLDADYGKDYGKDNDREPDFLVFTVIFTLVSLCAIRLFRVTRRAHVSASENQFVAFLMG